MSADKYPSILSRKMAIVYITKACSHFFIFYLFCGKIKAELTVAIITEYSLCGFELFFFRKWLP